MLRLALRVVSAVSAAATAVSRGNRRAAREALRRSEAHKASILQAVPNAVISTDALGCIIEFNGAAERTFGISRAAALGARMNEMVMPVETRGVLSALLSRSAHGGHAAVSRIETVGVRQDGTTFPMELVAVSHGAGRDLIWTFHLSDLTERHRAAEQMRRAAEAEVAARARSESLATMSHELRTPLSGVIGIVELLDGAGLNRPQRELIRRLHSAATALFGVVSDNLDDSRIEAGLAPLFPVAFSVRQCVEDALDPIAELATRQGLEIGYVIAPDVPALIVADQNRVRQVLLNLLSNAVKFTDAGEVAVHVSATRGSDEAVAISVAVRDTGCGIPAHLHEKLFQRFSHVDAGLARRPGSAGLGLPISQSLSRLLGGSLTVESSVGHGSTFTLIFNARLAPGQPATDAFDGSLSGRCVLAFIGHGIIGRQVRCLLNRWDVRLFAATDDDNVAPPADVRFDAIVVDAVLDGRLLAAALRRRAWSNLQDVPVIAITRVRLDRPATDEIPDHTVGMPVRAQALYDAIRSATGEAAPAAQRRSGPDTRMFAPGALSILLVEDDEANRHVVRLMLEELGLEVDEVANGSDAIARARNHPYDVIFMDVRLPDVDGLEATRRIKAEAHHTSPFIIALTASVMRGEEARCRMAGMDGYLPKPFRLHTLAAVLGPLATRQR